jgi:DNA-binding NarL/FixJ family response regulator
MSHPGEDEAIHTFKVLDRLTPTPARIVLVDRCTEDGTRRLLSSGAHGVLLRSSSVDHLLWAVRAVAAGSVALAPEVAGLVLDHYLQPSYAAAESTAAQSRLKDLSPREREILTLLSDGFSNPLIAETLSISSHTVKDHIRAIYTKLKVDNRVQAAQIAWQAASRTQRSKKLGTWVTQRLSGIPLRDPAAQYS